MSTDRTELDHGSGAARAATPIENRGICEIRESGFCSGVRVVRVVRGCSGFSALVDPWDP